MRLLKGSIFYIIAHVIDIVLTLQGLRHAPEGNPVIDSWITILGPLGGLVLVKTLMTGLVILSILLIRIQTRRRGKEKDYSVVLYIATILTLLGSSLWFTILWR